MLGCIQPISSPMMKRMLGFCCGCCAAAGTLAIVKPASDASRPSQGVLIMRMVLISSNCEVWRLTRAVFANAAARGRMDEDAPTGRDPLRHFFGAILSLGAVRRLAIERSPP